MFHAHQVTRSDSRNLRNSGALRSTRMLELTPEFELTGIPHRPKRTFAVLTVTLTCNWEAQLLWLIIIIFSNFLAQIKLWYRTCDCEEYFGIVSTSAFFMAAVETADQTITWISCCCCCAIMWQRDLFALFNSWMCTNRDWPIPISAHILQWRKVTVSCPVDSKRTKVADSLVRTSNFFGVLDSKQWRNLARCPPGKLRWESVGSVRCSCPMRYVR